MDLDSSDGREIRAARNQALFRAVNEKLTELNEAFVSATDTFVIACECADTTCVQTVEIAPDAYRQVRSNPRRFVVLRGHIYADIENVVAEADEYVIVEKIAAAGRVAEQLTQMHDEIGNGHDVPIDADRRAWLERLIAACDRVLAEDVLDRDDPYLRSILDDTADLRYRLRKELEEGA